MKPDIINILFKKKWLWDAIRIVLSIVFIFSGMMKLFNNQDFIGSLIEFKLLPEILINFVSYFIPILEVAIGLCLLFKISVLTVLNLYLMLLLLFTSVIIAKLVEGEKIVCNCFGTFSKDPIDIGYLFRNFALIFFTFSLIIYYSFSTLQKNLKPMVLQKTKNFSLEFIFMFLTILVIILSLQNHGLKKSIDLLSTSKKILQPNEIAPKFSFITMAGLLDSTKADNGLFDKKRIYFIMSTKCTICRLNMKKWNEINIACKNKDIESILISIDGNVETKQYMEEHKVTIPTVVIRNEEFVNDYKANLTPQTLLIDKNNKIALSHVGSLNPIILDKINNFIKN